jgi:hypothetical protein
VPAADPAPADKTGYCQPHQIRFFTEQNGNDFLGQRDGKLGQSVIDNSSFAMGL